jgi:hypothetical protein
VRRALVLLLALSGALTLAASARADNFVVNTPADTAGPTGCPSFCTIRNAVNAAGTTNGSDVIDVPAGTYQLVQGTLNVTGGVTIRGAGANATIIRPNIEFPARPFTIATNANATLSDLTVRSGRPTTGVGGNIQVSGGANLTLTRVRVFDGQASSGGGVSISGAGLPNALTISQSLIDGNRATGAALTDIGGGIHVAGATSAVAVTITDSTIFDNNARNGAGIGIVNNAGQPPAMRGVTLTSNDARVGTDGIGVGGIFSQGTSARFQGSIVGGNTTTFNAGPGPVTQPANCALAPAAIDEGGNVSFNIEDQCGLGGVHTNPGLATALDGSQPPVLTIPENSSARDIADCAGRTLDQRGVARPFGAACDAGAYEFFVAPPEVTPTPTPSASPVPTPTPTPTPTPVPGKTVVAAPVSGTILVKLPGSSRFVRLTAADDIPVRSTVDARDGVVTLTSIPRAGAAPETAKFWDGIFRVTQSRGITTLTLTEALAPCSGRASAAQRKPKSRKLWGDGKGKFRTKGRYSAATIRGTKWLVTDGCRFTRTRVTQGSVLVRDEVRKRNVVLRAGKSYTARPRR